MPRKTHDPQTSAEINAAISVIDAQIDEKKAEISELRKQRRELNKLLKDAKKADILEFIETNEIEDGITYEDWLLAKINEK